MATFLFSILLPLLPHITSSTQVCKTRYCGNPEVGPSIQDPFYLRGVNESGCGYSGFEVFCNDSNQTLLTLPKAGDFVVKRISLEQQKLWVNDPYDCLLARFLHDVDLRGSPFQWSSVYYDPVTLNFLNCTSNVTSDMFPFMQTIRCLSADNYSVVAVLSDPPFSTPSISGCLFISSSLVPVNHSRPDYQFWSNLDSDLELQWNIPECRNCEPDPDYPVCGSFTGWDPDHEAACYNIHGPSPGGDDSSSRNVKLDKMLGLGIAGAVCFAVAGLTHLLGVKVGGERAMSMERNMGMQGERGEVGVCMWEGLDGSAIEKYPKMQVGHSGRLPKVGDNVCSICLSEYEPMETLRTIPHCNHYFHAHCIDGWLKMKATCPLCRYLPDGSSSSSSSPLTNSTSHH